eukprot:403331838
MLQNLTNKQHQQITSTGGYQRSTSKGNSPKQQTYQSKDRAMQILQQQSYQYLSVNSASQALNKSPSAHLQQNAKNNSQSRATTAPGISSNNGSKGMQNDGSQKQIDFYNAQKKQDQSRSSSSSTTSEEDGSTNIDKKIHSLITQVQRQDNQQQEEEYEKKKMSLRGQSSNRMPQTQSNQGNTPVIFQAQHQPSAQEIQKLSKQIQQKQSQNSALSPTRKSQMGDALLPPQLQRDLGKKTLVLDLDETLVHSSFKPIDNPDIVQGVDIDGKIQYVYVLKRPSCEEFIQRMSKIYEIVMFTASLSKYAQPLYSKLDQQGVTATLLYREHCTFYNGLFVKDMERLGRPMSDIIIIDNSPTSYLFQPENALPSISWYDDMSDRELNEFVPILEKLAIVKDVRPYLTKIVTENKIDYVKARELLNIGQFINPEEEMQKLRSNAIFTPQKTRSEPEKAPSGIKQREMTHTPQQNNALQPKSNQLSLMNSSSKTNKAQNALNSSSSKSLSQAVSQQQQQLKVLQNSIEQLRQQQSIHQKKQTQIEDMKKRLMVGGNSAQTSSQPDLKINSELRSSCDQLRSTLYQNSSQQHQVINRTPSAQIGTMKQNLLQLSNQNLQDKENKHQSTSHLKSSYQSNQASSQFSLSEQKYQEYMRSLQKHQKRSGSQPQHQQSTSVQPSHLMNPSKQLELKTGRAMPTQSSIETDTQTLDSYRKSSAQQEHPRRYQNNEIQKRASSAQVRQPTLSGSTQSTSKSRPITASSYSTSSQHRSSSKNISSSLTQSGSAKIIKLAQQSKIGSQIQGTPDKQSNFSSSLNYNRQGSSANGGYVQSANVTPKSSASYLSSSQRNPTSMISKKNTENSLSALQQKNQELRKNYVNYIQKVESTNPSIGSQSVSIKTASLKLKDSQNKPGSAMNKFINKFESQSLNHQSQTPQAQTIHLGNDNIQTSILTQAKLTSTQGSQANKNHLSYSSIYAKLNQANQNFSLSPSHNSHQHTLSQSNMQQQQMQGNVGQPIRPSHMTQSSTGMSQNYAHNSGIQTTTHAQNSNPLLRSVNQNQQQQQSQSHSLSLNVNNSPAVNLIALQMLKNAQSSYHKHQ